MSSKKFFEGGGDKKALVPSLRFPEFLNSKPWANRALTEIGQTLSGLSGKSGEDFGAGQSYVTYKQVFDSAVIDIAKVGKVKVAADERQNRLEYGDVLFTTSSETPEEVGFASVLLDVPTEPLYLNSFCFCFRVDRSRSLIPAFSRYLFHSPTYRKLVVVLAQGSTRFNISKGSFLKLALPIPESNHEQQKIADCLSSIDDLISLEAKKLDALKTHKKGLMQSLFPAEGEAVPKLRFPEFRDAGEWEEKYLIDLAAGGFSNGVFNDPSKVGHGYKLVNVLDMYIDTPIDDSHLSLVGISEQEFLKNKVEPNDIFFTRSSLVKAGIAQSNIYLGKSDDITFDGHLIRLRCDINLVLPMFLHFALKTANVRAQLIAKGKTATMTTIGQADLASTKLAIPCSYAEQRKITDCLASLDELITEKTKQLEVIKLQKNGLMQRLFPVSDEVSV